MTGTKPSKTKENTILVGSRASKLALVQTDIVVDLLNETHPGLHFETFSMATLGDRVQNKPLYTFGGKALWTKELETLLLQEEGSENRIDMIVHSLKDVPTMLPSGCELGAILSREDPRDALVMKAGSKYKSISELPPGSVIGTSSIRRSAQLSKTYPNLKFQDARGNVGTRLAKLDDPNSPYSCLILAAAGLIRLNFAHRITQYLDYPELMYAVGQGALGVEVREKDTKILRLVNKIAHKPTSLCCLAERSLMRTLEGGCSVPIGVRTKFLEDKDSILEIHGRVISVDGQDSVESVVSGEVNNSEDAIMLGESLAQSLLEKGAGKILEEIIKNLNNQNDSSGVNTPKQVASSSDFNKLKQN